MEYRKIEFQQYEKKTEDGYFHHWLDDQNHFFDPMQTPFALVEDMEGRLHKISHKKITFVEKPLNEKNMEDINIG